MAYVFVLVMITLLSTGCIGFAGGSNYGYMGGGGVGLFLLIIVAALIFKRRR